MTIRVAASSTTLSADPAYVVLYNPTASAIGLMLAWAISVAVGAFFFRLVESRVR